MKKILFILFSVLAFMGCEKEIELNLNNDNPKLIVEGNVLFGLDTLITEQTIKLTETANYSGNTKPKAIINALVKVEEGSKIYTFAHIGNGIYTSSFTAELGKTYKLKIEYGGQKFEAIETMQNGSKMDSLGIRFFPSALGSPEGDFVVINTRDPANQRNFYLWQLYVNDTLKINPSPGNIYRAIQKDDFFNGQALVNYLPFDNFPVQKGDKAQMRQLNISENMFNFYYAIFNLTASSPVSGDIPSSNIRGNIINVSDRNKDTLGYFGACSVSIKRIKI